MHDFKARHEKLLKEAAECDLIANLTTDVEKRALFEKLARDYREMAKDIEKIIASRSGGMPTRGERPFSRSR
jgi:hypothetical protein